MKLHVKADRYQFLLLSGTTVLGHYTTVLALLEGARLHLRKDRTKGGAELRAVIENGIAHESRTLAQLKELAADAAHVVPPTQGETL